jgi:hypothetical protein
MRRFNARDWYWIVGGTGPHIAAPDADFTGDASRVFASARNQYVPSTDADYLAWKDAQMSANGGIDPTTRIDTETNLAALLTSYGVTAKFA